MKIKESWLDRHMNAIVEQMGREGDIVLTEKSFHLGNLRLLLIYKPQWDLYEVEIYRINSAERVSMHGVFTTEADAREVFDRVRL